MVCRKRPIGRIRPIVGLANILLLLTLTVSQAMAVDIRGGVYRENRFSQQPVPYFGAQVELIQSRRIIGTAHAGPDGLYYLRNISPGVYELRVNRTRTFPLTVYRDAAQDVPPIRLR
jgi:hypothetical protein